MTAVQKRGICHRVAGGPSAAALLFLDCNFIKSSFFEEEVRVKDSVDQDFFARLQWLGKIAVPNTVELYKVLT